MSESEHAQRVARAERESRHAAQLRGAVGGVGGGTLEYMPPERFNGRDSGAAGDLYSLGVTLFQAAEGFLPFHRETTTETTTETLTAVVLGVTSTAVEQERIAPPIRPRSAAHAPSARQPDPPGGDRRSMTG